MRLSLFVFWLIRFWISGERRCLRACRPGFRCIVCCDLKKPACLEVTAAFVSGSLWSVFIYLSACFSPSLCLCVVKFVRVASHFMTRVNLFALIHVICKIVFLYLDVIECEERPAARQELWPCLVICQISIEDSSQCCDPTGLDKQMKREAPTSCLKKLSGADLFDLHDG